MLLRQKSRQIQSFLRKHTSRSKFHQFCCQPQNEERSIDQPNKRIKQSPQRITLKRHRIDGNQAKICQSTSKYPHNRAYSTVFSTQQLNNFLSPQEIKRPQTNSFTKICFNYPITHVKSQEMLTTTEALPILGSQFLQRKFEDQQLSYQSLEYNLRVPVSEAKSASKMEFTISMQNPSQGLVSPQLSRPISPSFDLGLEENGFGFVQMKNDMKWMKEIKSPREEYIQPGRLEHSDQIIQGKMTQINQLKVEKVINQPNFNEKNVEYGKFTVEDSQFSSFNQSEKEKRLRTYRKKAEN